MDKLLYWFGLIIFYIYFTIFHRWEITGRNNIPDSGPLLVMANHTSNFDPPVLGCALKKRVYFLGKKELFNNLLFKWIFNNLGVIPIERGKPDISAIKKVFKTLKDNKMLVLFPEGTRNRSGKLGEAKAGSIMIALKSKTPILPVGIKNIRKKGENTQISIGKPFKLDKFYDKKLSDKEKKEAGNYIMNKIEAQLNKLQ